MVQSFGTVAVWWAFDVIISGLGRRTMPEALEYSVAASIQQLWLSARSLGIGVGWVSIFDIEDLKASLDVPDDWKFIAYLCVGYPEEKHTDSELIRHGWQDRLDRSKMIFKR